MTQNKKISIWLPLLFSLSMIIGIFVGFKLRDGMPGTSFFHTERQRPVRELLELIQKKYVDTVNIQALTDTAIQAMLARLDPHSVYIPPVELQEVNDDINGSFSGIGVEFNMIDDTMFIIHAIKDGPAYKAGLVRGDKVIKADGKVIAGKKADIENIRRDLRGESGTEVTLTIIRNGQTLDKKITRGSIPINSVDASFMIADSTGYIRLNKFSSRTYREFMTGLDALKKKGMSSLILDLRDNGGGVLEEAVEIADEFLDGDKLITYTVGRTFPKKEFRCRREGLFEQGKLVVLADESSASASEVLIGALQDWDRATIIGRRTFGKGLVQEQYSLSDGSAVRLTIARYYTPSGRSIQRSYHNGGKAYYEEIGHRIEKPDSLFTAGMPMDTGKKYRTMAGRIVYGGGGIAPDIFIPQDTSRMNQTISGILKAGIQQSAGFRILRANPDMEKKYSSAKQFAREYMPSSNDWDILISEATKDSINLINLADTDRRFLINTLRAYMARILWRNEGYFEVYSQDDQAVLKALEWLKK